MNVNASPVYVVEIASSCEFMPEVIDRVVETLCEHGAITQAREAKVRICMQEGIVNAIRHGNKGQVEKHVRVELCADASGWAIKIYDEGDGFNPDKVVLPDSASAGGRGLCLMRHFMDGVEFDPDLKCLELRIAAPQQTQGD